MDKPITGSPTATSAPASPSGLEAALGELVRTVVRDVLREELSAVIGQVPVPVPAAHASPARPEYLNTKQVSEVTGVADKTVRAWVHTGKLRAQWAGRLLRVERGDLERFMKTGLSSPGEGGDVDDLAGDILRRRRKA